MKRHGIRRMATCFVLLASVSSAFAEDAYIESTGTQAISLGRKMTPQTRWEVDFALTDVTTAQQRIFGVSSGAGQLALYVNGSLQWSFGANAGGYATSLSVDVERHVAIGDPSTGKGYIVTGGTTNGTSVSTFTVSGASDYPLAVFGYASNAAGTTFGNFSKARVYGFKVWESGELVMHGVPALKDGIPCFYDTVGGGFYTNGVPETSLGYGGDIKRINGANLSSDGNQIVNTRYTPSLSARIEVDFALNSHVGKQERIFGTTRGVDDVVYGLYCNGQVDGAGNFSTAAGDYTNGHFPGYDTGVAVDLLRHTAIVDFSGGMVYFVTGTTTNYSHSFTASSAPTWLMGIYGEPYTANFSGTDNRSDMRLYSAKVYEGGVLVHHWLPYKDSTRTGLKDVVTGDVFVDGRSAATPFTVDGCGWGDGGEVFYSAPTDTEVARNGAAALYAYAPGAVAYQWLVDGEIVAGATGLSFNVPWRRSPKTASVSARAFFNVGGEQVYRDSDPALLTMAAVPGLLLIFK